MKKAETSHSVLDDSLYIVLDPSYLKKHICQTWLKRIKKKHAKKRKRRVIYIESVIETGYFKRNIEIDKKIDNF
jgi:hypothetical protein